MSRRWWVREGGVGAGESAGALLEIPFRYSVDGEEVLPLCSGSHLPTPCSGPTILLVLHIWHPLLMVLSTFMQVDRALSLPGGGAHRCVPFRAELCFYLLPPVLFTHAGARVRNNVV